MRAGDDRLAELVRRTEGLQPWRKLFHAASGVAMVAALQLPPVTRTLALAGLGSAVVLLAAGDLVRLTRPGVNVLFFRAFPSLASPREAAGPASSTWYALGTFLAILAFPREHAAAGILVLALADPAASLVGVRWGRRSLGAGSPLGSLTFFAVAFLVLVPFAGPLPAVAAAALTAAVEAVPLPLDDNLTVPLAAAGALWIVATL